MPKISLNFGVFKIEGNWTPDDEERKASWEMYVELITRIAVQELRPKEGLLREALSSLYTLFESTRKILRKYGTSVAQPKNGGTLSFGYIAVAILNRALRPLLTKWHPLLHDYESTKKSSISTLEHEMRWDKYEELRGEINKVREHLEKYASYLVMVANVQSLHTELEAI